MELLLIIAPWFTHLLTSDIPTPLRVLFTMMHDMTSLATN